MGLMDSMITGSAVANVAVGGDLGAALWLFVVVNLVASGVGILAKAHRGKPIDLGVLRRPKAVRLAASPSRLCEVGGV
jgi:hypothetical protein